MKVLFLQGGASLQFIMTPYNLMKEGGSAAYLDTGSWSSAAIKEAKKFGTIDVVASSKETNYDRIPKNFEIQLTAFAQELRIYDNEKEYNDSQTTNSKFATQSFIPSGLFSYGEEKDPNPPQATGMFTGIIKQYERKRNELTNEEFYWLLVDTLGGEVDIVADIRFFEKDPVLNGIVQGQFWLSGQLANAPKRELKENKTFFQKLFGR